jgi:Ca2+-binding RTX toxin-like protein
MFRRSATAAVTALVTGVLLSAPSSATSGASPAAETCQGRPATIVGNGPHIQGTEGDDVIVTGASATTYAGAGDDLICVSSDVLGGIFVLAGDGDDVVDASRRAASSTSLTKANLGNGLDQYIGSSAHDEVDAHGVDDNVVSADHVQLDVSGPVTGPQGAYASTAWAGADTTVHGSIIRVWSADQGVEIDLAGHLAVAGVKAADIAGFSIVSVVAPRAIVRGNAEDNMLRAAGCHVTIVGKGGDDYLDGYVGEDAPSFECLGETSETTMRGGSGDDEMIGPFDAVGGPKAAGRYRLIGNAGSDKLRGGFLADVLLGGRGHDELSAGGGSDVLRGNQGRDTLRGDSGRDVLLGNRGRDRADGGSGRDVCVAERERRCER